MRYDIYNEEIIIYGAGYAGLHFCELLLDNAIVPLCILDRDTSKHGLKWQNIEIKAFERPSESEKEAVVIICMLRNDYITEQIYNNLKSIGFKKVIHLLDVQQDDKYRLLFSKQNLILCPDIQQLNSMTKEIEYVNEKLDWAGSRIYLQVIECIKNKYATKIDNLPIQEQYLAYDLFKHNRDEIVFDVGAFNGQVYSFFCEANNDLYSRYYAFEPDPSNYGRIDRRDSRLIVCPFAVSDETGQKVLGCNYLGSNSVIRNCKQVNSQYEFEVETLRLDDFKKDNPTFIKIDTEGYEEKVLNGATETIRRNRPIIAIAIYHSIEQLVSVPMQIFELTQDLDYKYTVRSYMNVNETVLYAIPEERLI